MPWLHKSKKTSRIERGDGANTGAKNDMAQPPLQQQKSRDDLQSALNNVLEALHNLTERQQQTQQQPQKQQRGWHPSNESSDCRPQGFSHEKALKKLQQQPAQPKQEPPPISSDEYKDALKNQQLYLNRASNRGQSFCTAAAPSAAGIVQSGSTFTSDQLDPPSSASRLRRRNYRPHRRELMPPEADLVSGLTSVDVQASEDSRDDDDDPDGGITTRNVKTGALASSLRQSCISKVRDAGVTAERARPIGSSLLQPPTTIMLGCVVVTHWGGCLSRHQHHATVLLLSQPTATIRPPVRALNGQLPPGDEVDDCPVKASAKILATDASVKVNIMQNVSPEAGVAETIEKSVERSAAPCSAALNTCADDDSLTTTTTCSTPHPVAVTANHDEDAKDDGSDGEASDSDEDNGGCKVGVNSNNSIYRHGFCHHRRRPNNQLQMHSVVESKLLERACESFPPAEVELAAPSSSSAAEWEPPRFGKVELPPEQPRPAEPMGRFDSLIVSGGRGSSVGGVGSGSSGLRSCSSIRSATTLEVLDNADDDVGCDADLNAGANGDNAASMSSCCTYDIGKSSGFTRLLLMLDRAHRRLEGLPPSALPPPSGDTSAIPTLPVAHQHHSKQRASVQTLNKMLLRSPFVSRRKPSPLPTQTTATEQSPEERQQPDRALHSGCWTSQSMQQHVTCQTMPEDQSQPELVPDSLIFTTATSLMTLSQSLQRCVLQIEAAVTRLNGNQNG